MAFAQEPLPQAAVSPLVDPLQSFIEQLPILPKHKLTPTSRRYTTLPQDRTVHLTYPHIYT